MSELKGAARQSDFIDHGAMKGEAMGKIAAAVYDTGKTAYEIYRIAKVGVAAVGVAAAPAGGVSLVAAGALLGASFVVEWAVSKVIEEGVKYVVKKQHTGVPEIQKGSPNVYVNKLPAARGGDTKGDPVSCHKGKQVKQGSQWVSFNKLPAARLEDLTTCPGNISSASANVAIGGPPTDYNPHQTLENALFVLTLFNAAKKGAVKGAASGTSMFKAAAREGRDALRQEGANKLLDNVWEPLWQ